MVVPKSPEVFSGSLTILSGNSSFWLMFHDFLVCHRLAVTIVDQIVRRSWLRGLARGLSYGARPSATPFS